MISFCQPKTKKKKRPTTTSTKSANNFSPPRKESKKTFSDGTLKYITTVQYIVIYQVPVQTAE